jgi:hypothetical protein
MLRRLPIVGALAAVFVFLSGQVHAATISVGTRIPISATEFALPVEIVGAGELTGWEFSLLYNPTDVQIDTGCDPSIDAYCDLFTLYTTEGDFYAAGVPFNVLNPGSVLLDLVTLEQTGTLLAAQGLYGGPLPAPSGDGVLAYVRFITLGDGESPIQVVDSVVTEAAPVPEPSTLLLVTLGLPFTRRYLRRR